MSVNLPPHDHFDVLAGGVLDPSFNESFVGPSGTVSLELLNTRGAYGGSGFFAMQWISNLSTTGDAFIRYDYRIGTEVGVEVPEPMALSAFLLGSGMLAASRRSRRRAPATA